MKKRIKRNQHKGLEKESGKRFKVLDTNEDGIITWEEYKDVMFASDFAANNGEKFRLINQRLTLLN